MRRTMLLLVTLVIGCAREPSSAHQARPHRTVEQSKSLALSLGPAAVERAQKAAKERPELADRWVVLGQLWVRQARASNDAAQYLAAEAAAEVALSLQPGSSAGLALQAVVALNQHRFAVARDVAQQALKQRDDDLLALAALADAQLELGELAASAAAVQQMIDLKPNLPSYGRAAHLRWLSGDAAGAQALYRQAISAGNDPRDPEPQAWMAVQSALVFLDQADLDGAEAGADFALQKVNRFAPALVAKAKVALARGDAAAAVTLFDEAYRQSPLVDTLVQLAEAQGEAGDEAAAEKSWAEAERLGPALDAFAFARGLSEAGRKPAAAVRLLEDEVKHRPNSGVLGAMAWAYFRIGSVKEARAASERALASGWSDARLRYQHAAILAAAGERDVAARQLELLAPRVAALSPRLQREAAALTRDLGARATR